MKSKTTLKSLLVSILATLSLIFSLLPSIPVFADDAVNFPDVNLAAAIRAKLGLAEGADIHQSDLENLAELKADGKNIAESPRLLRPRVGSTLSTPSSPTFQVQREDHRL